MYELLKIIGFQRGEEGVLVHEDGYRADNCMLRMSEQQLIICAFTKALYPQTVPLWHCDQIR